MKKKVMALVAALTAVASISASAAESAAEIENLSAREGVISVRILGENVRLYFTEREDGAAKKTQSTAPDADGYAEVNIGEAKDGEMYLWENGSLRPLSSKYYFKNGRAYKDGSDTPVPEFDYSNNYIFDHTANVVIVSSVTQSEMTGLRNGETVEFPLAKKVEVMGLASSLAEIKAGDIVLPALNDAGVCGKIDVMMTVSMKSNEKKTKTYMDYKSISGRLGVYSQSDGSERFVNVVAEYVKNSLSAEDGTLKAKIGTKTETYKFESPLSTYTKLTVTEQNGKRAATVQKSDLSGNVLFPEDGKTREPYYYSYLFMRLDTKTGLVTEAVLICPVTAVGELAFYDDEYSPGLWSLDE